jgi:hypothetical protein
MLYVNVNLLNEEFIYMYMLHTHIYIHIYIHTQISESYIDTDICNPLLAGGGK